MSKIGETVWDDEAFPDRVNVIRSVKTQDDEGVSRPVETIVFTDMPCKIQYPSFTSGGAESVTPTADLVTDRVAVAFAEDIGLRPGDLLQPRPPSVGSRIRAGAYRYDADLMLYMTIGVQTT